MKFNKEDLQELVYSERGDEGLIWISSTIVSKSRWYLKYRLVFEHDNKFYQTFYNVGATEYQECEPFEHSPNEVECQEVEPIEELITVYKVVK